MNESFKVLMKLILPEGLEEYFELTSHKNEGSALHLYLKELNIIPTEYSNNKLVSKGFFDEVTIQELMLF